MQVTLRRLTVLSALAVLASITGTAQSVTVTPGYTNIGVSTSLQYTATVTGLANTSVTWLVSGVKGGNSTLGSISATGLYNSPAKIPTADVLIEALASDGKTLGEEYVNIEPAGPVITSISPNPILTGSTAITVTGKSFQNGATISMNGNNLGTTYVSSTTLKTTVYQSTTAAAVFAVANPGSLWGPAFTASFTNPQVISPTSASVTLGKTKQFTSAGATSWAATAGTISSSGLFTAPSTMPASSAVTVTAKGPGGSASAKVTLVALPPVAVSVSPATASLSTGAKQAFKVTVSNATNTAVTWTASCGTLSSATANPVTYTAPTAAGSCTVTATSQADSTKTAKAIVTVTLPVAVSIAVSPTTASIPTGGRQAFTATVSNSANTAVTWTATCGTLSSATANPVTYTASTAAGSCTVTASSQADSTKTAKAIVTVTASQTVSVSVSPATAGIVPGGVQAFTATVLNTANTAVTWTASCGTLSNATANPVTYTAPAAASSCTVTATSQADATKSATAAVTVALPQNVTISITPTSSSFAAGGTVQITATVVGSANTSVTWTANSASGNAGTITGSGNTIVYTSANPGVATVTATSNANSAQSATADILVIPSGQTYPAVPYPVAAHPRLWVTPADVTRLQGWANDSNPIYAQGMAPVLQNTLNLYNTQFFPGGVANSNWPDPGDVQGYTGSLAEENAMILAFNSLIDPSPTNRITYAQDARNLIMVALNQAALGQQANAPYRDPAFPVYNRASATGQDWPLVVDWIYDAKDANGNNILTAADKATIRNVFLIWAADCLTASTTGGDSPQIQGVINSTELLPNNQPYRMASNNYYLAHARLLTMMALAIDPADDPAVEASQPAAQLGNTLRSYLSDATGAWLYQEYAMMGDPQTVATAYGIAGGGAGFGLASGGLPPEGMLYGESFGYALGQLLALQTAGFNNSQYADFTGPQIGLIGAPVWGRWIDGMLTSLIPTSFVPPSEPYIGPVYEYASYGDMLRLWVEPDNVNSWTLLNLLENENGSTTHQAAIRWFGTNVLEGGAAGIANRMQSSTWGSIDTIEYFMLLDPGADTAADPRSSLPLEFYDPGAGRIVAHSDWTPSNTLFDYHASWESINHQDGNAGEFEMYRKGEWLTKEMSNYDNNGVGLTTYYHNTLALKNTCPAGTPSLGWDEVGEWNNGSQFMWGASAGDPATVTSSGTGYVYAASDLTNLYNRPDIWDSTQSAVDITRAQRSIFWLNNDYIVVYDRATSKSSGLFKRFNLSLAANPTLAGENATETMADGQQLFIHTLLPLNASIAAREADTDLNPIADLEPTKYVMTVQDSSLPADTRFLHVLQGADAGVAPTAVSGFASTSGTAFDGALVGNSALLFIHDETQTARFVATAYTEPSKVTANYIAGLSPSAAYTVQKTANGANVQIVVTAGGAGHADAAGVLVF